MKKTLFLFLLTVVLASSAAATMSQFQMNHKHTGEICDVALEEPLCIKWRRYIGNISDGAIPMANDQGDVFINTYYYLFSYDADGNFKWKTYFNSAETSMILYNGMVILNNWNGFRAFSQENGHVVWSNSVGVDLRNSFADWSTADCTPTLFDGSIYIGSKSGQIVKISADTGDIQKLYAIGTETIAGAPTIDDDGDIYAGDSGGNFYCVDNATGNIKWQINLVYGIQATASLDDTSVYVASGAEVYCLDKENGNIKWSYLTDSFVNGSGALHGDAYHIGSDDRYVYAFFRITGGVKWKVYAEDNFARMSCIIICGKLYITGCIDKMVKVDVDTGFKEFTCHSTLSNFSSPGYGNGNIMFVSVDGYLYVIGDCPPACTSCGCDARPTATYEAMMNFTVTPTFTATSTFTPTDTYTNTVAPTDTYTNTLTFTATPTETYTDTFMPTSTYTETATFTETMTFTFTFTQTETATHPPCDGVTKPEFKVEMIFNPESTDYIIFEITSSHPLEEPPVAVIYPHGCNCNDKKEELTFTSELIPGEIQKYRILYPKRTGFGDIDKVVVKARDVCGAYAESDGSFTKRVISDKDVKLFNNVIKPDRGERCTIRYKIYVGGPLAIRVYDRSGRMIKELRNETVTQPGDYEVCWDGDNEAGKTVTSGIYYVAVQTPYYTEKQKIAVIR